MQSKVKVVKVDKFTSKKGNPCAFVYVSENNGFPFRILIYDAVQVSHLPQLGSECTLYTDIDSQLFGILKLNW